MMIDFIREVFEGDNKGELFEKKFPLKVLLCGVFQTASEFINTSAGVNKFLLTGEKRMTF